MSAKDAGGSAVVIVGLSVICAVLLGPRWWIVLAIYGLGTLLNIVALLGKRQP